MADARSRRLLTRALSAFNRRILRRRLPSYRVARPFLVGRRGLEIGGPSDFFARHGAFPVYADAGAIDNCNFSAHTVWRGAADAGQHFTYDPKHPPGRQYITEAAALSDIGDGEYDFVLASHTLEHLANPLRALVEWRRVLAPTGILVVIVPDRRGTFDHRRPITTFDHLVHDFDRGTGEDDVTHLPEILDRHDLTRDPQAGDYAAFKARSEQNLTNRCLHHHVFDEPLLVRSLTWAGATILATEWATPYHILAVGQRC
ncbi:MAG TPA: methyltransferase domain-containing protein [Vicinamibacterales bacterium]|nr:methyltransferase domain-containing protein [Vicinamibacterales bacterium]